jgi:hypothetical protein
MGHLTHEVRIDTEAGMEMVPVMSRFRAIVCAVLLILWMPATSHCALEEAGLLPATACCESSAEAHCAGDVCRQLESGLYKQTTASLKVVAPELLACACTLCLQLMLQPSLERISDFTPTGFEAPRVWMARWTFEHRTALLARAPSLALT